MYVRIDHLFDGTHELLAGKVFLDQGECIYIRRVLRGSGHTATLLGSLERRRDLRAGRRFPAAQASPTTTSYRDDIDQPRHAPAPAAA